MSGSATIRRVRSWLGILVLMLMASTVGLRLEHRTGDLLRRIVPQKPLRHRIVIVELPSHYAFSLPLEIYRTAMQNLKHSGVAAVAWEYYFGSDPSTGQAPQTLAEARLPDRSASSRDGPAVVHRVCRSRDGVLLPRAEALEDADGLGTMDVQRDPDQVVRGVPAPVGRFPPIGTATVGLVRGEPDRLIPTPDAHGGARRLLDPRQADQVVRKDCFEDLLRGPRSDLKDAIVFVGVYAPAEATRYPLSDGRLVPATLLQATIAANYLSDALLVEAGQAATIATLAVILLLAPLLFVLGSRSIQRIGVSVGLGALIVQAAMLPAGLYLPISRIWIAAFAVAALHTQGIQQAIYIGETGRRSLLRDFIDAACLTRNMLHATKNALLAIRQRPEDAFEDPATIRAELQPWLEQLKSGFERIGRLEDPMLSIAGDLSPATADTIRRDLPALLDRWTATRRLLSQIRRNQSAPYLSARIDSLFKMLTAADDGLLAVCDRILHQFELGGVVQEAVKRFRDNGADLTISESLLWRSHLDADPAPLQHIVSDTVANAVQANGDAPRIRIDVEEADPTHMQIWIRDDGPAGAGEGMRRLSDVHRDGDGRGCGMLNAVNVLKRLYDGEVEICEDVDGWGNSVGLRVRTAEND